MKIVITDKINLGEDARKQLEGVPGIQIFDDVVNDPKVVIDRLKDAEVATANYIDLTREIIESCPNLKYIISPAKGFDWIDSQAATEKGIKILNCPTFNAQAVAEHAIALVFAVKRKIIEANKSILNGDYDAKNIIGTEVGGKTLVTIGHGEIGKRVIKIAEGLGMKTRYIDSKSSGDDLDNAISVADVLVLCMQLNDSTRGLINTQKLALLKKDAVLINVARGLVIDQQAFYEVLQNNKIAGAGIDTFAKDETISKPTEEILNFTKLNNVVATPHIAYNTVEAAERLGGELLVNINSCIAGNPINIVN